MSFQSWVQWGTIGLPIFPKTPTWFLNAFETLLNIFLPSFQFLFHFEFYKKMIILGET